LTQLNISNHDPNGLLQSCATTKHYAKALLEWTEDKKKTFQTMMDMLILIAYDEREYTESQCKQFIIDNSDFNPECWVPTSMGYVKLHKLLRHVTLVADINSQIDETTKNITLVDSAEQTIEDPFSLSELVTDLKASLHSVVSLIGAIKAFIEEDARLEERISIFREYLSRTFENAYSDLSQTAEWIVERLEIDRDLDSFLRALLPASGIETIADDNSAAVYADSDLSKYTGASPMGPLDFSAAAKVLNATTKVGAKIVWSVYLSFCLWRHKVFTKTKKKMHELHVDPVDLDVIDERNDPFIDGFCWEKKMDLASKYRDNPESIWQHFTEGAFIYCSSASQAEALMNYINTSSYIDKITVPFSYDCPGARVVAHITSRPVAIINSLLPKDVGVFFDLVIKIYPKSLSPHSYIKLMRDMGALGDSLGLKSADEIYSTSEHANAFLSTIKNWVLNDVEYLDVSDNEVDLRCSFGYGLRLLQMVTGGRIHLDGSGNFKSLVYSHDKYWYNKYPWPEDDPKYANGVTSVTNVDFINAACGYHLLNGVWQTDNPGGWLPAKDHSTATANNPHTFWGAPYDQQIALHMLVNLIQRSFHPLHYPFLPYSTKDIGVTIGKFRIKTDYENYVAFNKFWVNTIIISTAVVMTVALGLQVLRFHRIVNIRYLAAQRMYGAALLTGKVTPGIEKEFNRCRRIYRLSQLFSCGLQATVNAVVSSNMISDQLDIIRGSNIDHTDSIQEVYNYVDMCKGDLNILKSRSIDTANSIQEIKNLIAL